MLKTLPILVLAALGLSACVEAGTMNSGFGQAYQQNLASQVADPEASYVGKPDPGSDGARVGLAQHRYRTGTVIKPVPATASQIGVVGRGGDQGAGAAAPK